MATIKARISPDGSDLTLKVEGVAGAGCESLTSSIEEAIFQAGESNKELTPDYFREDLNVLDNHV